MTIQQEVLNKWFSEWDSLPISDDVKDGGLSIRELAFFECYDALEKLTKYTKEIEELMGATDFMQDAWDEEINDE